MATHRRERGLTVPSTPSALVFDLDGTLSDPAVGIGRSLNHALTASGFAPIPESQVSRYIGPPLDQTFHAITGTDAPSVIQALVAKYRERYADVGYAENVLYAGMSEAVAALAERGLVLGVCTSKRVDFAEKILQMFGLRTYFAFVDGGEIGTQKAQQLRRLLDSGTIDIGSTMIGDRAVDVVAAKSNGLRSVGVSWGHGTVDELHGAGADAILTHVAELARLGGSHAKGVLHEGL
jgi:phosphoglycolate phosphatase